MACWKRNEFSDAVCAKEIQTFLDCAAKAEVIMIFVSLLSELQERSFPR